MPERVVMVLSNDCVSDPRVEKEAAVLVGSGREVVILAWDREGAAPLTEERSGFRIERLGPRAAYGGGVKSLPAFRGFWANAERRALELRPDVVHCHDLDTAVVGERVRRHLPAARLVLDFHELYRDSAAVPQTGLVGALARTYVDQLERRVVRSASLVFVAPPGAEDHYRRLAGDRFRQIENAPDSMMFRPRVGARPVRPFTVGYIGSKRYVEELLLLIDIVGKHDDMNALLAGGGIAEKDVERAAEGVSGVRTEGRILYEDIPSYYEHIDASWVLYDPTLGNAQIAFPVKVMESMACAIPVVVYAKTWMGEFVERNGVGIAIDPERVAEEGEAALVRLRDDLALRERMGAAGRAVIDSGLSWQAVSAKILAAYDTLG